MRVDSVCILGGSGFVGRHIANRLANTPVRIRVITTNRERSRHLLPIPNLELVEADIHDADTLRREISGFDAVINLVGVLNDEPGRGRGFDEVHVRLVRNLVEGARAAGVKRLLHMSALGAAPEAPSRYQQTKAEGERIAMEANRAGFGVTVFRPSVIFGPEDNFLNQFATMLRMAPFLPLPTPEARFKPVYVGDVAQAFVNCLNDPDTFGERYELCGPSVYTLRELVSYCAELIGTNKPIIGLSDRLSRLQARVMERVPGKPYSMDNYLSSQVDNVCSDDGLARLGIHPTAVEAVVPMYVGRRRQRQYYNRFRRSARRV
ncbi:N-acetyl-alpha-D-glucosaminyl-diphospho-ditrans,octacis-undecaprenol 4-epimerase [wastewater metagenome]|uniref:N-acetyl-alpha-D-glucosaminyl-diphospho-ditrans, octacis-undecaprenol 4-epimerase n=2 Tax=unclassified sequences TaxID=12908 RepID=A0A5B8RDF0_9ZZZZ|nr:complex I NDUFA9 subunit family protein [Arhodomonas sp. KWT]QEA04815.1 N-acetyl-alpha-D-glucosaminyl-diphospho-ditrans,octacis-undecaprenol 4-epimerase [uncultured organism]